MIRLTPPDRASIAASVVLVTGLLTALLLPVTGTGEGAALAQVTPRPSWTYFYEDFSQPRTLEETGSPDESASVYWWLNSGGLLTVADGIGMTVQNELRGDAYWRERYAASNPTSTDNGYHPQNILRLFTRTKWRSFRAQAYFRITGDNVSRSEARNASNGLLLFGRYQDDDNLYYAGVRVDGAAVIKRKWDGAYTTLGYVPVLPGDYDRATAPNLLPHQQWIGVRLETRDTPQGDILLTLYVDLDGSGVWRPALSVVDTAFAAQGVEPWGQGYAGIRTDFMDVEFDDFLIERLNTDRWQDAAGR